MSASVFFLEMTLIDGKWLMRWLYDILCSVSLTTPVSHHLSCQLRDSPKFSVFQARQSPPQTSCRMGYFVSVCMLVYLLGWLWPAAVHYSAAWAHARCLCTSCGWLVARGWRFAARFWGSGCRLSCFRILFRSSGCGGYRPSYSTW